MTKGKFSANAAWRTAIILLALLVVFGCAGAELNDNSAGRGYSYRHYRAAERLLLLFNMDKLMNQISQQMYDMQIKVNPSLKPYKEVMMKFFNKYLSWENIKDEMIEIYINEFTVSELNEMIAFYQTPTGRKVIDKVPKLMKQGGEIGVRHLQENLQELNRMVEEVKMKSSKK